MKKLGAVTLCNGVSMVGIIGRTLILSSALCISDFGKFIICLNFFAFIKVFLKPGITHTLFNYVPKFELSGDESKKVASICWLCVYVAMAVSLPLSFFGVVFSKLVATKIYGDESLAGPLCALAASSIIFLVNDVASSLLRLKDKMVTSILPATLVSLGVFLVFCFFPVVVSRFDYAVYAVAASELLMSISLLALLLYYASDYLIFSKDVLLLRPIKSEMQGIKSTLKQTSIFGLLHGSSEAASAFLIGVFSSAKEVAYIGMAIQLARPVQFLHANVASVVVPRISKLYGQRNLLSVMRILKMNFISVMVLFVLGGSAVFVFGELLIIRFLNPEYLQVLPVFYILIAAHILSLATVGFVPLSVAREQVDKRNYVVALRFLYLGVAVAIGLNAYSAAIVQLMAAISVRFLIDLPMYKTLKFELKK